LGKARDSFEEITEDKRFAVGVVEKRYETKFCEGGDGNGRGIDADRLRVGKDIAKVVIDDVDGGEVREGKDNRVKHSIDSGEGSDVGAYIVLYVYFISSYRPSHSPFPQSVYLVPLLLDHSL
jgi:hypothetical protein